MTSHAHSWMGDPVIATIRAELARRGIRHRDLPSLAGQSQAYWARRLLGETDLSVNDLRAIARALGLPVVSFFADEETPAASAAGAVARPEGFEPPTFCLAVGGDPLVMPWAIDSGPVSEPSDAVVIDITDRLPIGPVVESSHLAPVVVLR